MNGERGLRAWVRDGNYRAEQSVDEEDRHEHRTSGRVRSAKAVGATR